MNRYRKEGIKMNFTLDIDKLRNQTTLSPNQFDKRLEQVQEGGFGKREATAYLLGKYLFYRGSKYVGCRDCTPEEIAERDEAE